MLDFISMNNEIRDFSIDIVDSSSHKNYENSNIQIEVVKKKA